MVGAGDGGTAAGGDGPGGRRSLSVRQAAFIGVGSMVGAGIFALLGAAGEVAGSAVWISFILAGGVSVLQGYSFAKLGARYPSAGGFLEYVVRGWGDGHFTGVLAWLLLAVNAIITAMVAVSFGSYASDARRRQRRVGEAVRGADPAGDGRAEHPRRPRRRPCPDRDRRGRRRHPDRVLDRHPVEPGRRPARVLGLSLPARHRVQRGADLLRLPRLRCHHLHRQGPRRPDPPAPQGDLPGAGHRDRRLRRRRPRACSER